MKLKIISKKLNQGKKINFSIVPNSIYKSFLHYGTIVKENNNYKATYYNYYYKEMYRMEYKTMKEVKDVIKGLNIKEMFVTES